MPADRHQVSSGGGGDNYSRRLTYGNWRDGHGGYTGRRRKKLRGRAIQRRRQRRRMRGRQNGWRKKTHQTKGRRRRWQINASCFMMLLSALAYSNRYVGAAAAAACGDDVAAFGTRKQKTRRHVELTLTHHAKKKKNKHERCYVIPDGCTKNAWM